MEATIMNNRTAMVITPNELVNHWQGHRRLTRKVIEAYPEKEFFEYSVGGMRPFAGMVKELLAIGVPGLRQMVNGQTSELNESMDELKTKSDVLKLWDEATLEIDQLWAELPIEKFHDKILAFGQYEGTVISSLLYFIDNEIHHRGQGYVFLRTLGIEPPFFWER